MSDGFLEIEHPEHEDRSMSLPPGTDKFHALLEQSMAQIGQTGVIAQNNFVTTTKAQDLDYIEGKRIISNEEAMGIREVASKSVPAGPSTGP